MAAAATAASAAPRKLRSSQHLKMRIKMIMWARMRVIKARRRVQGGWQQFIASIVGRKCVVDQYGQDDESKYEHPVWNAIKLGDIDGAQAAIQFDASCLELRGDVGETPLHWCFLYYGAQQRRIAFWILDHHPDAAEDIYEGDQYLGENCLHMAVIHRDRVMAERLVQMAPQLLQGQAVGLFFQPPSTCYYGEHPLFFAACTGQREMVDMLLVSGAELAARDSNGNSIFHMCVWHGLVKMYGYILTMWKKEDGDPATLLNDEMLSPLTLAAKLGKKEMLKFLLSKRKMPQEWQFGEMVMDLHPLDELDYIADTKHRDRPTVIQMVVEQGHEELLALPQVQAVLTRKWETSLRKVFFFRLLKACCDAILFTLAIVMSDAASWFPVILARLTLLLVTSVALRKWWQALRQLRQWGVAGFFMVKGAMFIGNVTNLTFGACFVIIFILRFYRLGQNVEPVVLAVAAASCWLHLFTYLLAFRLTGPFIVMIAEMLVRDLLLFLPLYIVFTMGFSTAFTSLCGPPGLGVFFERLERSVLMMVGQYETLGDGCQEGLRGAVAVFFTVFNALLVSVLMVNLLVAMMGGTYNRISQTADSRWRLELARIMLALQRELPPSSYPDYWQEYEGARYIPVLVRIKPDCHPWQKGPEESWGRRLPGRFPTCINIADLESQLRQVTVDNFLFRSTSFTADHFPPMSPSPGSPPFRRTSLPPPPSRQGSLVPGSLIPPGTIAFARAATEIFTPIPDTTDSTISIAPLKNIRFIQHPAVRKKRNPGRCIADMESYRFGYSAPTTPSDRDRRTVTIQTPKSSARKEFTPGQDAGSSPSSPLHPSITIDSGDQPFDASIIWRLAVQRAASERNQRRNATPGVTSEGEAEMDGNEESPDAVPTAEEALGNTSFTAGDGSRKMGMDPDNPSTEVQVPADDILGPEGPLLKLAESVDLGPVPPHSAALRASSPTRMSPTRCYPDQTHDFNSRPSSPLSPCASPLSFDKEGAGSFTKRNPSPKTWGYSLSTAPLPPYFPRPARPVRLPAPLHRSHSMLEPLSDGSKPSSHPIGPLTWSRDQDGRGTAVRPPGGKQGSRQIPRSHSTGDVSDIPCSPVKAQTGRRRSRSCPAWPDNSPSYTRSHGRACLCPPRVPSVPSPVVSPGLRRNSHTPLSPCNPRVHATRSSHSSVGRSPRRSILRGLRSQSAQRSPRGHTSLRSPRRHSLPRALRSPSVSPRKQISLHRRDDDIFDATILQNNPQDVKSTVTRPSSPPLSARTEYLVPTRSYRTVTYSPPLTVQGTLPTACFDPDSNTLD